MFFSRIPGVTRDQVVPGGVMKPAHSVDRNSLHGCQVEAGRNGEGGIQTTSGKGAICTRVALSDFSNVMKNPGGIV